MSHYNPAASASTLGTSAFGNTSSRQTRRAEPSAIWRRNQNTVRFRSGRSLGPVAHTVLLSLLLAVLGLIYLTQITKTSTYGYEINSLEKKRTELTAQKNDLEVENAKLQALERVQANGVAKGMDKPVSTEYVQN
jgi:hypothetical protein